VEALYGHPNDIELYVGVQAEEAKKPFYPGSGLCPGFTISAAILSDAVALVRGDRFYTVDYSPTNLTNFGWVLNPVQGRDLLANSLTASMLRAPTLTLLAGV
jgi:hypothetical protein